MGRGVEGEDPRGQDSRGKVDADRWRGHCRLSDKLCEQEEERRNYYYYYFISFFGGPLALLPALFFGVFGSKF